MSAILKPIFNRAGELPSDGWYHIIPRGEFPKVYEKRKLTQVIDEAALQSICNRFSPQLLIDQEHFSYDTDKSTEAMGWVEEVQVRPDGLWGRVEWTDLGSTALSNRRYRFISPVWMPDDVEELGGNRIRPLKLDTAGLTNRPNMLGMKPLVNREDNSPAGAETETNKHKPMKTVATKLGLSEDASEGAILAEVTRIANRAESAEAKVADLTKEIEPLRNRVSTLEDEQIDTELKAAGITEAGQISLLKPSLKAIANRDERQTALAAFAKAPTEENKGGKPLTNRETAKTPADNKTQEAEEKKAGAIRNRASALRSQNPRLTLAQSYQQAEAELGS